MCVQQPIVAVLESNAFRPFLLLGRFSGAPAKSYVGGASNFVNLLPMCLLACLGLYYIEMHGWEMGIGNGVGNTETDTAEGNSEMVRRGVRWSDTSEAAACLLAIRIPFEFLRLHQGRGKNQVFREEETRHGTKETSRSGHKRSLFLWIPSIVLQVVNKVFKRGTLSGDVRYGTTRSTTA